MTRIKHARLTPKEEHELADRIKLGDFEAREKLIVHNMALVISVAKCYTGRGVDFDDIVNDGMLGLIHAAEHYNSDFGTKFATYAKLWIVQAIKRGIMNHRQNIRIPINLNEEVLKWNEAESMLSNRDRLPTTDEIAKYLGFKENTVERVLAAKRTNSVLRDKNSKKEFFDLLATIKVREADERLYESEEVSAILVAFGKLRSRDRSVLEMRFGFNGDPMTLDRISKKLRVTRERVRQIQNTALERLKALLIRECPVSLLQ